MLATCVGEHPEDWEEYVSKACMAYNTSVQATTGFTPFYLMFGRQARIPVDLMYGTAEPESISYGEYATKLQKSLTKAYKLARESLAEKQERQTELYNKKVHGEPYEVGVFVWLLNPQVPRGKSKKLHKWWTGPFKVVKRLSEVTYRIQHVKNRAKRLVVHFDRLKKCHPNVRLSEQFDNNQSPANNHTASSEQQQLSTNNEFGTHLELVEDVDATDNQYPEQQHPPPQVQVQSPQPLIPRRYPTRNRHPPDFFSS